jgi:ubiquinol-cytochrome c reductase cytochrome b/c1 subunit
MAHPRTPSTFKNPVVKWVDDRLPIFTMLNKEYGTFPTPRNFNYMWNFGAIAMIVLVTMILSGIFLAMNYTPSTDHAFNSVERIMRDVNYGWLIRYIHANGASMFFIAVYIHLARGLYYGSYKKPRELLWILGVVLLLLMMATAFMGYVLPWGQMSFWGATVITNLFSAIPLVGDSIVTWLWGGFSVDNPTLNRFFALHYLLPFVIIGVVGLHVAALHISGSNNPAGVEPKTAEDTVPFHPYYTAKDSFGTVMFLIFWAVMVFFAPNFLGHSDNYIPANPLVTPAHIVPEWYFLPFYAILRSFTIDIGAFGVTLISSKLGGVLLMGGAIIILMLLPWLDRSPVKSARYRPLYRKFFWLHFVSFVTLGWVGSQPAEGLPVLIGQIATVYYFLHFLVVLPLLSKYEKTLPVPDSITASLKKSRGVIFGLALMLALAASPASANTAGTKAPQEPFGGWSFEGLKGTFDRASLQRGFQVYKEVCSACHSMNLLSYRNLTQIGFSDAEVKAIAAQYQVPASPNDEGEVTMRPGLPSDRFVAPFANEQAARFANNGALPPDLSLIVKARSGGASYIYSLLTGYDEEVPEHLHLMPGMSYNPYFPGGQIGMPKMLTDGAVTYTDGTVATAEQLATDVTTFLTWAAEPNYETRKRMGLKVLLYLVVLASVMYAVKRRVWSKLH